MLLGPTSMKQPLGGQTGMWEGGKMLRRTFFFFFPPKNRHGILTEAPHKVLEIQNHVGLSTSPETSFRRTGHRALGQLAFQLTLLFPTSVSNLSPLHRP